MNFKEFLYKTEFEFLHEVRKGPTPGAFGKQSQTSSIFDKQKQPVDRQNSRFSNRIDSVKFGISIEKKIVNSLRDRGWTIQEPTEAQDMYDKVDGFLVDSEDPRIKPLVARGPMPFQIKYRDTGDDIGMEVIKPWKDDYLYNFSDSIFTGRDMKGLSQLYIVANKEGTRIRVRSAHEAKEMSKKLVYELIKLRKETGEHFYNNGHSEVRMTNDPRNHVQKIMAFLNPNSFKWKVDYSNSNIWAGSK